MPNARERLKPYMAFAYRAVLRGVFVIAAFLMLRAAFGGNLASAATDVYYPTFCLGGWQGPKHASGMPALSPGADASAYTTDNSAFLDAPVSAQIFCGYFPVKPRTNPPVSVHVTFRWFMPFLGDAPSLTQPEAKPVAEPAAPEPQIVIPADATTTPVVEFPSATPFTSSTEATSKEEKPAPAAQTEASTSNADSAAPAPAPTPTPTPEPTATPAPASVSAPAESSSSSDVSLGEQLIALFSPAVAHAQEVAESSTNFSVLDFMDVRYSFDGVRWIEAGRVNRNNWKDFSISIPTSSWDDLHNLQIMVASIPTLENKPPVYLSGVELRIDNDLTLSESAADKMASAAEAASNVFDFFGSIADTTLATLTGTLPEQQKNAEPEAQKDASSTPLQIAAPSVPQAPVTHEESRLVFTVTGSALATDRVLPWQDDATQKAQRELSSSLLAPTTKLQNDGQSLVVSGACGKARFVVLTYRQADDYRTRPESYASNYGGDCENGTFSYDLSNLPVSTPDGDRYLLVGAQGESGSWVPASKLLPIRISHTTVTVTSTSTPQ